MLRSNLIVNIYIKELVYYKIFILIGEVKQFFKIKRIKLGVK